jgi:hypothetical protein
VTASQANLDKALDLANDLFNSLESVGHRVVLASADAKLRRQRIEERSSGQGTELLGGKQALVALPANGRYVGTIALGLSIIEMSENVIRARSSHRCMMRPDRWQHPTTSQNPSNAGCVFWGRPQMESRRREPFHASSA